MNTKRIFGSLILSIWMVIGGNVCASNDKNAAGELFSSTEELSGYISQVDRLNPLADGGLGGEIDVFGVKASVYIYSASTFSKPVMAILLPTISLGTIAPPLKGTPLDVTLESPVVFVAISEGYLEGKAPAQVADRANTLGLPSRLKIDGGFNIFGKVAGREDDALHQVLKIANLKAGLVAGYSSPSRKVQLNPDDAKKVKYQYRVVTLTLPAGTNWESPFHMKGVSVSGALIRLKRPKIEGVGKPSFQIIGGASIGKRGGYHLFAERFFDEKNPASQPMLIAINPDKAVTMGDFLDISRTMREVLGLPGLPDVIALPLDSITLENPFGSTLAFPEEGAPPDFNKVMFAGASPMVPIPGRRLPGPLLTANARARIFGYQASDLKLNFDVTGINATAKANLPKIGPLELGNVEFDTAIKLGTAPHMHLKGSSVLGDVTVAASSSGLKYEIPPKCPLAPIGLGVEVTGFDPTKNFKIETPTKNCLEDAYEAIEKGGEEVIKVVGDVADGAIGTANQAGKTAEETFNTLGGQRALAWGKAIDNKVGPTAAYNAADKAWGALDTRIKDLARSIEDATRWIEDQLGKLVGYFADAVGLNKVKEKKRSRANDIDEHDAKLTEQAAAAARRAQAEEAMKKAANLPVPYHDENVRKLQEQQLGQMVVMAQQKQIAAKAGRLKEELKTEAKRKELLVKTVGNRTEQVAAYKNKLDEAANAFKSSGKLEQPSVPSAGAMLAIAIEKQLDETQVEALNKTVPELPTIAFGKRVLIQDVSNNLCMKRENIGGESVITLRQCDGGTEQIFSLADTGLISIPDSKGTVRGSPTGGHCLYGARNSAVSSDVDNIHIKPYDSADRCLKPQGDHDKATVTPDNCGGNGFRYTPSREFYSLDSHKCFDGKNNNINDEVYSYTCHGSESWGQNQHWTPHPDGTITNVSGNCLALANGKLRLEACSGGSHQKWAIIRKDTNKRPVDIDLVVNIKELPNGWTVISTQQCGTGTNLTEKPEALFFFDPIDGMIRNGNQCVTHPVDSTAEHMVARVGACPVRGSSEKMSISRQWKLIDATVFKSQGGVMKSTAQRKTISKSADADSDITNLAPLRLPMKPGRSK